MIQKNIIGFNSFNALESLLSEINARNILLVTGKNSFERSSVRKDIYTILSSYSVLKYSDFSTPLQIHDVEKCITEIKNMQFDCVVAIGGGGVIDMAKLVSIFSKNHGSIELYLRKEKQFISSAIPIIAIPTTAGSGSEATHFAVLYDGHSKYSVAHQSILPYATIIDATFTIGISRSIAASSGMDAICQAIESYWSVGSTEESLSFAKQSLELSIKNFIPSLNLPAIEAKQAMIEASYLAGKAINISKTTGPHALSYPLTTWYNIPHGNAVALFLPIFIRYNWEVNAYDVVDSRGVEYVRRKMSEIFLLLGVNSMEDAVRFIQQLIIQSGLVHTIRQISNDFSSVIEKVVAGVNIERLTNNPRLLSQNKLKEILFHAL